jgi:hypothetical protein
MNPEPVQTIQLTRKVYKLQGCLAGLLMLGAAIVFVCGMVNVSGPAVAIGALLFVAAAVWRIVVSVLIWWHHA